ncbi:MAG: RNA polymerase sigma-70 factor (ECF subfamily), partial [Myxococcota bacterium]
MTHLTPLVAAARTDPSAYAAIVDRFQDAAFATAYARLGCAQQAREVAQEALLEGWVRLETLRVDEAFTSWFRRIVFKQIDRVTRRKSLSLVPLHAIALPGVVPRDTAEAQQLRDRITAGLDQLSEPLRTTFTLFYLAGWPITEIAAWLQIPPGTIKKRLHTARRRLQADMEDVMTDYLTRARPSADGRMARQIQLYIAARSGDLDATTTLLAADPGLVNAPETVDLSDPAVFLLVGGASGHHPLHLAASFGHATVAAELIRQGAAVNATSRGGLTPLHTAAQLGHTAVVSALLAGGADRNATHDGGLTALHIAAIRGDATIAAALLDAGADPTVAGRGGRTPAHWAS